MTGRFTSTFSVAWVICLFSELVFGKAASYSGVEHCVAAPTSQYASFVSETASNVSESCFVRESDISGNIDRYLVVDLSNSSIPLPPASRSVRMSGRQLKLRHALKRQPLLIVDEPHKRYSLAKFCSELIQDGFQNPKILIGDTSSTRYNQNFEMVSPEEFIVEASNFGAVVIALGRKVANQLEGLGLSALIVEGSIGIDAQLAAAEDYSINGYLPVFLVGDSTLSTEAYEKLAGNKYSVMFFPVAGGIEGVQSAVNIRALNAVSRDNDSVVSSCAR
ncbi:hypothetical protein HXX02_09395 [Microbulbifer elongatus]|uniref:Uncharacterized protein n=1 Tax=Microbulbifer elongatus TaxID=86173 RepID=A0ABT1P0N2_9GAMM|nr:hypothetical protein [Microbulbifer elongatus]MCQ3829660.1 hypothetical protein [Microbulbifer elongatus]